MLSKARIGSHPLHPMLVAVPITSYLGTFAGLAVYAGTGDLFWFRLALWANVVGVVSALVAAVPGLIDYLTVVPRGTIARKTGAVHAVANVVALGLFAINLYLLYDAWTGRFEPPITAGLLLTGGGILLTGAAGFFGWEMVQRHHVGVLDRPDKVAVDDPNAVAARWMDSQSVTDSQVIQAREIDRLGAYEEEGETARWPAEDESGRLPRH
jgi:uncharacterized membrane protein